MVRSKIFLKRSHDLGNLNSNLENRAFSEPLDFDMEIIQNLEGERQSIFQTTTNPIRREKKISDGGRKFVI